MAHVGASMPPPTANMRKAIPVEKCHMRDIPDDEELKALNDAIQIETDPKRLTELVHRMIEALDAKGKDAPKDTKQAPKSF